MRDDADPPSSSILRDAYGVPHVFAQTEAAGMLAFGYAQAQDRLPALLRNLKQARGELAEWEGLAALPGDIAVRAFRLAEIAGEKYASLDKTIRADLEAFCVGVNRFQRDHPAALPPHAFEVAPVDVVAFAQFINLSFASDPFESVNQQPRGSNAFAVAGEKTAAGHGVIVSLDPHLPLQGFLRWYEAHLCCGPLNVHGITFVGLPFLVMGHNGRVAWANTVNQPDLSDWYEERVGGETYEYDGQARPLTRRTFLFEVRQNDGTLARIEQSIAYTHHGPILRSDNNQHFACRKAGAGDLGLFAQVRAQSLAGNVDEYRRALEGRHVVMFNHVFGDATGRVGYVWSGQIPARPQGWDFHRPLPGWTSATEWGEPVAFDALPQILDPAEGFVQSCNDAPPHAAGASFPLWLVPPGLATQRGFRLTELLASAPTISVDDAKTIATDVLDLHAARQLPALLAAARRAGLNEIAVVLAGWDQRLTIEARGAALFQLWCAQPAVTFLLGSPFEAPPPIIAHLHEEAAVNALRDAAEQMGAVGADLDVPWGAFHRHRRGNVDLPSDGGIDSLTPNAGAPGPDGLITVTFGASFRMIVELGNELVPRAWSCQPYGNSDDPASPHFSDQMPLAAKREWRRVPWTRAEVEAEATAFLHLAPSA